MENTVKFKTNIKCSGCIEKVTPHLNGQKGIENWEVDTASADKVLTVKLNGSTEKEVITAVENAGYKAEKI